MSPEIFEKLGVFYLGRLLDPSTREPLGEPLLYDSRDLTTHAVCIGMTGSGKTGLGLALLEEAALDGIPAIVIDPKGDLGNLLLTFPHLRAEDFLPWVQPGDAERRGLEVADWAAAQAAAWREGLAKWGQDGRRIQRLRERAEFCLFTPGSTAGHPVNVLSSFAAPARLEDAEALAQRAQAAAASLLSLAGIPSDPLQGRESVFLSALLAEAWQRGETHSLESLIARIQHPPFERLGVLDVEAVYPAKERFGLVLALNNLLAAPQFAAWRQGEPMDVARFLRSREGRPRISIFSIAHLADAERMFFVTLLLNETIAWMRAQSGTASLRAILFMDEIFGYLPPTANPPSKPLWLTLLKQARAFGLGIVVATQNPVDLDYKALTNAGTWFLGRLQTERDKARVLDGLLGSGAGSRFDRAALDRLLSGLSHRKFLLHNVHAPEPCIFETRWVMSYLRGPLTQQEIRALQPQPPPPPSPSHPTPAQEPKPPEALETSRPVLSPDIPQVRLPGNGSTLFEPRLLGCARVTLRHTRLGFEETLLLCFLAPVPSSETAEPRWAAAEPEACKPLPAEFPETARFSPLPSPATRTKNYPLWEKNLRAWLISQWTWKLLHCAELKLCARPGESETEFRARATDASREARDAALDKLRAKYAPRRAALLARLTRAEATLRRQSAEAQQAKVQSLISIGSSLLGALLSKNKLSSATITRAGTAMRGVSRAAKQSADVGSAKQSLDAIQAQLADLDAQVESEVAAIQAAEPRIETLELRPSRTGISETRIALAWIPVSG